MYLFFEPITSLDQKMEEFYPFLSIRVVRYLQDSDVVTVGDLTKKAYYDLIRTPNFGRKSLEEVKTFLATAGLALRPYYWHYDDPEYKKTGHGTGDHK